MPRDVRLGLVRFLPTKWDVQSNWRRLTRILEKVNPGELDLVITPECIVDGYVASQAPNDPGEAWKDRDRWLQECALDISGPIIEEAKELAEDLKSYFVLGFTQRLDSSRAANAAAIFNREGEMVTLYHKTHLQNHDLNFEKGNSFEIIDSDFGVFGVLICADRRWPEATRCLRIKGAEFIANPTYGMHGDLNRAMMRTRSYENGFFIAFTHPKRSMVTGPHGGLIVDRMGETGALVRCSIDLDSTRDGHLVDRRTDLYQDCLLRGYHQSAL